jgi:anti-sigma factor RsiW
MNEVLVRAHFRRDHRWSQGQMSAYVDGELTASRRERLERHLGNCPDCRHLLAGLRAVLEALRRTPAPGGADPLAISTAVRRRLNEPPGY